MSSDWETYK